LGPDRLYEVFALLMDVNYDTRIRELFVSRTRAGHFSTIPLFHWLSDGKHHPWGEIKARPLG
ncbi:MAG: hypothetical protein KJP23_10210, partial [Deltaproteobacteria bacterium]|nr:hypothetical protein [Deltaproteobacteria bacterium]